MDTNQTSLKILVSGDANSKFSQLFSRVIQVNRKAGPFDMLLCVGEFFADDSHKEWYELIHGSLQLPPMPVYLLGPMDERLVKYYTNDDSDNDFEAGFELTDGVIYLGKKGILSGCSGVRIAYLSGKEAVDDTNNKHTFNKKDYDSILMSHQSSSSVIDILMTSEWPKHIFRFTDGHSKLLEERNRETASELVAKLSHLIRPRYHFVGGCDHFYERHPYRNHRVLAESARHVTRFVSLASVGNQTKGNKWLYAFSITPAHVIDKSELIKQPIDVTENPYIDLLTSKQIINENKVNTSENVQQFFFDMSNENNDKTERYNKRKRNFNDNFKDRRRKRGPQSSEPCWFCLASPEVEKHLIISIGEHCYLAMAKGGLTHDHLLILPIGHYRSTLEIDDEAVENEIIKFKEALISYFDANDKSVVFFERNFKSSHLQIQVVPIAKTKLADLKSALFGLIEERALRYNELTDECQLKELLNAGVPYFYMESISFKFFIRIKTSDYFPLQLGRELMAHPLILNCEEKIDWKKCALSKDESTVVASNIRKSFQSFDFTLT